MEESKKIESTGLDNKKEDSHKEEYIMPAWEKKQYDFYIDRFTKAKNQREKQREYFDDLSYEQDYLMNERAKNSYLRRKINEDEVRVNTPTTENKVQAVANEILNLNLQPQVIAFDQDDTEIIDLGRELEDIVTRTNEIENDDDKYIDAIFELLTQRALFVEEVWVDKYIRGKREQHCEKRILSGLQVYLGDITLPAYRFNEQPYIIKYEKMNYEEARSIWGKDHKWIYVKKGDYKGGNSNPFGYRMSGLASEEVEVLHYVSSPDDEYRVMINGVMMGDKNKLPWRWEGYNITMIVLKPMAVDFSYGKSLISSAKTLQALDNETIRNLIRKMRQAIEPPTGVKAGKIYSRDIWNAGSMVQGARKDEFEKLIDHDGVTQSELQMLQLIEGKIGDFIGSSAPLSQTKRMTSREVQDAQKQAIKMLGLAVFAAMRVKRNMTFLRIYNIMENMTKPTGKKLNALDKKVNNTYRRFTINNADIDENKKGKKMVQMMDRNLSPDEMASVYQYEEEQSRNGKLVRVKFMNVKELNSIKINWFVSVINKERDSSELARAQFADKIKQGAQITELTQRPMNANKLVETFEKVWNSRDLFEKQAPKQPQQQPGQGGAQAQPGNKSQIASQILKRGGAQPMAQPSVNTLSGLGGGVATPQ